MPVGWPKYVYTSQGATNNKVTFVMCGHIFVYDHKLAAFSPAGKRSEGKDSRLCEN